MSDDIRGTNVSEYVHHPDPSHLQYLEPPRRPRRRRRPAKLQDCPLAHDL